MVMERDIDILCISETWLLEEVNDSFLNISNFNIFRCDYGRGGGVSIYVKDIFKVSKIDVNIPKNVSVKVEDLWITLQCRKLPSIIVGVIYRHPHALNDAFDYISDIFKEMCLRNKPIFVLGDLNDDLLFPNAKLKKIIKACKLSQIIDKPTRITETSATLLDVLITNNPNMIVDFDVLPHPIADHELITAKLNLRKPKRQPESKTFRSLINYDPTTLCNLILEETYTLNKINNTDDVNLQVEIITEVLNKSIDTCAPMVTKMIRRPPAPWMDVNIKSAIEERNIIQRQLKLNRNDMHLQSKYKSKKKLVKRDIQKAKSEYFKGKFNECGKDTSKTWKIVKTLVPNKVIKSKVSNFEDIERKVEEFNNFFANVGKVTYEKTQRSLENVNVPLEDMPINVNLETNFRPQPVTVETVILTIKHLKDTRAVGADGIALQFVRDSLPVIVFYILIIINTSIVTGIYPSLWKYAIINPTYKSGDTDEITNYRPISLLPILSKILEKIVANQLMEYLETNYLLSKTQHGFRSNLSTETALIKVTNKIYENMDRNKISLLTLCDLSKAFDSVNHETLLQKLRNHQIDNFWFENYISHRCQSVKLGNAVSSKEAVTFGVPQGSILGPILFLIFVNDMGMLETENCIMIQYADDTQFLHTGTVNELDVLKSNAESTLKAVANYFNANGLLINANKTQCIIIGSRQNLAKIPNEIKIKCDGYDISPCNVVKNLGVYIDRYMTFETHIDELYKKTIGILMYINRIKDKFERNIRIAVVQVLALSILNYCSLIWGAACNTQIFRIQKLQNFAARIATGGVGKYDHITPHIRNLKWLKMNNKFNFDLCIFVFKIIINKKIPDWIINITTVGTLNPRTTRQSSSLAIPRTNSCMGDKNVEVRGPKIWNELPNSVKESHSFYTFKKRLKDYFLRFKQ